MLKLTYFLFAPHLTDEENLSILNCGNNCYMCSQSLPSHGRVLARIAMQFDICLSSFKLAIIEIFNTQLQIPASCLCVTIDKLSLLCLASLSRV